MRKASKFEQAYFELERMEREPITDDSIAHFKESLNSNHNMLVAKAAHIIGNNGLQQLIPDMITAFSRLMASDPKYDKGCSAKTAIVKALNELEYLNGSIYLACAYYTQVEPAYGGPVDTAIELRCLSAFGLARSSHQDSHFVLTDLLADVSAVQAAAAKSLAYMGTPEAEVLLRLKLHFDDISVEVANECMVGLMTMSPERSLEFVKRYLDSSNPAIIECAALAIGGSRLPRAFSIIRECWDDNPSPSMRRALLLPIALLRSEEAFDFLLQVVRKSDKLTAEQAVSALGIYADDVHSQKVQEALASRK